MHMISVLEVMEFSKIWVAIKAICDYTKLLQINKQAYTFVCLLLS